MVRVASLKSQVEAGISKPSEDGKTPLEQLLTIRERLDPPASTATKALQPEPAVEAPWNTSVQLLDYEQLNEEQRHWVARRTFQTRRCSPCSHRLGVDPAHPFPFVSNLSLNVAAVIQLIRKLAFASSPG